MPSNDSFSADAAHNVWTSGAATAAFDAFGDHLPQQVVDELFRPFATTKDGGHGIGAYQARELLREAGGDLLVLSRKPGGTTMRLLLPSVRLAVADVATLPA